MPPWIEMIIAVVVAIFGSSGLWAFIMSRREKNDVRNKILLGLGHDRIIFLCRHYLDRGDWITYDEYENLHNYLYMPYKEAGGNGAAKRAMEEVDKRLTLCSKPKIFEGVVTNETE